jgi:hypothetical protein
MRGVSEQGERAMDREALVTKAKGAMRRAGRAEPAPLLWGLLRGGRGAQAARDPRLEPTKETPRGAELGAAPDMVVSDLPGETEACCFPSPQVATLAPRTIL